MTRAFNIDLYAAFIAVSESGGFTAAAQRLHRTQATVSQQITRLEGLLGRSLFRRTTRHVQLTAAGEAFLPYARRILQLHEQAASAVHGTRHEPLRLGVPDPYAEAVLPGFIDVIQRETEATLPVVNCHQSVELFDRFSRGELDIVLTARYPNFPAGRTVSVEELVWVGHPDFDACEHRMLPLIVYPDGCPFRARAVAALNYVERPWEIVYAGQSGAALHVPLQLGLGITVMARHTIPAGLADVGEALRLPAISKATLDLHVGVPVVEQYGEALEDALWQSAVVSLAADG